MVVLSIPGNCAIFSLFSTLDVLRVPTILSQQVIKMHILIEWLSDWMEGQERHPTKFQHWNENALEHGRNVSMKLATNSADVAPGKILPGLFVSVVLFILVYLAITSALRLRGFAGPKWAVHTRLWICWMLSSTNSAQLLVDINKEYGSIARIGPNNLVTDDPDLTRQILAVGSKWRRGPWFDSIRIDPRVPNIVSERDPRTHNAMRRRMSAGYAGKDIEGLEDIVDERITEFIDRIEKNWVSAPGHTRPFDIARRVQFFTIDTITHVCFGRPMGFVESDTDKHNFIATIETQLPIVQHFSVILSLNTVLRWIAMIPPLRRLVVPSSQDKNGIGLVMGVSEQVCTARLADQARYIHGSLTCP